MVFYVYLRWIIYMSLQKAERPHNWPPYIRPTDRQWPRVCHGSWVLIFNNLKVLFSLPYSRQRGEKARDKAINISIKNASRSRVDSCTSYNIYSSEDVPAKLFSPLEKFSLSLFLLPPASSSSWEISRIFFRWKSF